MVSILLTVASLYATSPFTPAIPQDIINNINATITSRAVELTEETLQCTCPDTRSVLDIVWSCLATVFLCTWVSIHPNVPPAGEHSLRTALRRLKIMLWGVLGPEMILIWAVRQWSGARIIAKQYEKHNWTATHGFFLLMGGFVLIKDGEDMGTISPDLFRELYYAEDIQFPSLTIDEIEDKSKGDFLSKSLVVLQTLWFIIQCIARAVRGLAITELEIITLAFCSLNATMYYFWWYKPLDVQCRVPVYLKPESDYVHRHRLRRAEEIGNIGSAVLVVEEALEVETMSSDPTAHWLLRILISFLDPIRRKLGRWFTFLKLAILNDLRTHHILVLILLRWPLGIPLQLIIKIFEHGFVGLFAIMADDDVPLPGANRVETFYSPETEDAEFYFMMLFFTLIGSIFGGLHCIPWNFDFPTHAELVLWRVLFSPPPFLLDSLCSSPFP